MSSTEVKYFTSRQRRFSNAIDVLGSFLFVKDGVLLFGSGSIVRTASGLINLKVLLYPREAANVPRNWHLQYFLLTLACSLVNDVVFPPTFDKPGLL